ncbi:cytochrome P450 1B1, partial [Tulasnella sp. 417]
ELVIELTYGRLSDEDCDEYIRNSSYVVKILGRLVQGHIVDFFPFLKYLPHWLPGMGFKRDVARWRQEFEDIRRTSFEAVKESALSGGAQLPNSYMVNKLKQLHNGEEKLKDAKEIAEEEAAISHTGFSFFLGKYIF